MAVAFLGGIAAEAPAEEVAVAAAVTFFAATTIVQALRRRLATTFSFLCLFVSLIVIGLSGAIPGEWVTAVSLFIGLYMIVEVLEVQKSTTSRGTEPDDEGAGA